MGLLLGLLFLLLLLLEWSVWHNIVLQRRNENSDKHATCSNGSVRHHDRNVSNTCLPVLLPGDEWVSTCTSTCGAAIKTGCRITGASSTSASASTCRPSSTRRPSGWLFHSVYRGNWSDARFFVIIIIIIISSSSSSSKPGFHSKTIACVCCVKFSRNKLKRQPIGMLGRSSGNLDWLLANASDCVWMETGLEYWHTSVCLAKRSRITNQRSKHFYLDMHKAFVL